MAFQKKVVSMGVHYLEGEVVDVAVDNNMVSAVKVGEVCARAVHNQPVRIYIWEKGIL